MSRKCRHPFCDKDSEFLPVHQLPLCEEHYQLMRFIETIMFMHKWEPKWADWTDERIQSSGETAK